MNPDLFTLPFFDWPVKSYGAMLTLGFLTGVWLSMKRAERLKADPDIILNIGLVCLFCGVGGARLFYVAHYWESTFAKQANPLFAALDCTSGGLEYYGGLLGAIAGAVGYMLLKRASVRMYLDILAPAAAWGLAFGRMGCLLNGCCWGGICVDAHGHQTVPWGIEFPHSSPAQTRQWENRQLTLPAELIITPHGGVESFLLPATLLDMPVEQRVGPPARVHALEEQIHQLELLKAGDEALNEVRAERDRAVVKLKKHNERLGILNYAQQMPSRRDPSRPITVSELEDLADAYHSRPVHPAQIYGIINALLLSWLLLELLYRRRRHGIVFATLCLVYPVTRIILESVRVDNPHDSAGLTISQAVSVGMILFGAVLLYALSRMPERSPRAIAYVPPEDETQSAAAG